MTYPQEPDQPLLIDCDTCVQQHTLTCDDCVVNFLLNQKPGEAIVIDIAERRSMRLLANAGLIPPLRHSSGHN